MTISTKNGESQSDPAILTERGETYLGDGLYVSFDGWQIVLRAPRQEGDHWVALEPEAYGNLIDYVKGLKAAAQGAVMKPQPFDPAKTPGHTDMMVTPESLDVFMAANPLPEPGRAAGAREFQSVGRQHGR